MHCPAAHDDAQHRPDRLKEPKDHHPAPTGCCSKHEAWWVLLSGRFVGQSSPSDALITLEYFEKESFNCNFPHFLCRPYMYDTPSTYRGTYSKSPPMKSGQDTPDAPKSTRLIPLWVQFVFFLAVAAFLYLVFSNMETNESLKEIQWFFFILFFLLLPYFEFWGMHFC